MMDKPKKKKWCVLFIILLITGGIMNVANGHTPFIYQTYEDYDPLVNISVTLKIKAIRFLETNLINTSPDFYLKIAINTKKFTTPIWHNKEYIYPGWETTVDVPDNKENVTITLELWNYNDGQDILCDINSDIGPRKECRHGELYYSIKNGWWTGDDYHGDPSGYGRLNGCDDGTIYNKDEDCELLFSIYQNDYDSDTLPYWQETQIYKTNPFINDTGVDYDGDQIPIEWEHKWKFSPLCYDDHIHLDHDNDSLTNKEEYQTKHLESDPFRRDVFLELDFMTDESNNNVTIVSTKALELLKNPFHRRNIIFIIMTDEFIPFDEFTDQNELLEIYQKHFIKDATPNGKRSIFHYGTFVHNCVPTGYSYAGDGPVFWGYIPGTNGFIVSKTQMEKYHKLRPETPLNYFHASVIMHEIGHHFGIRFGNPYGCDNHFGKYPWQISYWIFGNYKSVMNYRYTYQILDYSDGSHGKRDFNDWTYLRLDYFEK